MTGRVRLGRNDPCHCGSVRKYKRCHLDDDRRTTGAARTKLPEVARDLVAPRMSVLENQIQDLDLRVRVWTAPLHADMLTRIGAGLDGADAAMALRGYLQRRRASRAARLGRARSRPSRPFCVCTPVPEWIALTERGYWLTDTIPRICTPDELLELLACSGRRT